MIKIYLCNLVPSQKSLIFKSHLKDYVHFNGNVVLPSLIKYLLNIPYMVLITCKKCGELNYLTPHTFWNISDFGARCEKCETINTITLENGELRKQL